MRLVGGNAVDRWSLNMRDVLPTLCTMPWFLFTCHVCLDNLLDLLVCTVHALRLSTLTGVRACYYPL